MSSPLTLQATHPFQGSPSANQVSFFQGAYIVVKDPRQVNVGGWTFGTVSTVNGEQSGWFPSTYAQPIAGAPLPIAHATPVTDWQQVETKDSFGFEGAPMGGQSTAQVLPPPTSSTTTNNSSLRSSANSTASKVGGAVSGAASKTGSAVSGAASAVGSFVRRSNKKDSDATPASSTTADYGVTVVPPPSPPEKKNRGFFRRSSSNNNPNNSGNTSAVNVNTSQTHQNTHTNSVTTDNNTGRIGFFQPRPREHTTEETSVTTTTTSGGRRGIFGGSGTTTTTTTTSTTLPPEKSRATRTAGDVGRAGTFAAAWSLAHGDVAGATRGAGVAAAGFAAESRLDERDRKSVRK